MAAATFSAAAPQSDQQLQAAAHDIANTQVNGGLQALAQIIAQNNQQATAAQKTTAGLYGGLSQDVQKSNAQLGSIGAGLNTTLQGIGDQTQQTIGAGLAPDSQLSRMDAQGLGGGGVQALAAEMARQKGFAAQDAGAFRSAGAIQGANYGSLGASHLGTFAVKGQEGLNAIGRAQALGNMKTQAQQSALELQRGPLYQQALGKLTDAEANRELARATLGVKVQSANTQAAAQRATAIHQQNQDTVAGLTQAETARYHQLEAQLAANRISQSQASLSETQRHNLATEHTALVNAKARLDAQAQKTTKATPGQAGAGKSLTNDVAVALNAYSKLPAGANTHPTTVGLQSKGASPLALNIARDLAVHGKVSPVNKAAALAAVGGNAALLPPSWLA